ncbi:MULTISPECIES: NAD(P)H-dependent flavin oxidoreductase [unclassified Solwaraspora]|uniref:NAD(P)H-dependent flavin oxidoreductase n=1 Tax=unclassified Solwaraspora TaxID=2627926 RepID=UPI00259BB759|nr:nitronate monooxygenase [Solwaraspora sp. WMMA2056]WJK38583.1 nitronate monooxygenase [Solwaraspora sp. WMMA2056]
MTDHPARPAAGPPPTPVHPALRTPICELFGVRYPIVQTGMGFVSGPRLVAATAEAGGLGILAGATLDLPDLAAAIAEIRRNTMRPFGVNVRADAADAAQRIDLLIRENVRVASFALAPKPELIARLKQAGVLVVPSVGARRHAEKVAAWGADAVVVQGAEGGGHTGAVPTSLLLPQVVDAVDIPVIGAGGFFDGRGLVAALAYGAAGVAMGTRFLLTSDSTVDPQVLRRYLDAGLDGTVVTRALDGVPQRVLRTDFIDRLERAGPLRRLVRSASSAARFRRLTGTPWRHLLAEGRAMRRNRELTWGQVLLAANTPMLLRAAMVDGRVDLGVMATGQVTGLIDDLPSCAELIDRIVAEATAVLDTLQEGRPDGDR